MVDEATIRGGSVELSFTGGSTGITAQAAYTFNVAFGPDEVSAYYVGGATIPPPGTSSDDTVVISAIGANVTLPSGYLSVFDVAGSDSVGGGDSNITAYLQGGLERGTVFDTGNGSDIVYAGGDDSITAGTGSNTVYGGSGGTTVAGGAGSLYFEGGAGSVSVSGGQGNTTLFGSTTGTTYLAGGSGGNVLIAGSGALSSLLVGGENTTEFGEGSGLVQMVAGTGTSLLNGLTGTGQEILYTGGGTALMALNGAADSVVGGSGTSTVLGGTGQDVFGFIAGHAGGTELILNLKASDVVAFSGYGSHPITNETVTNGSDVVTLSDNTTITFAGFDHKIFNDLG